MILEALNYLASLPVTASMHRGFVRGSVNLWSRARRCASDWAEHERHCHDAVRAEVAGLRQRRTVVVLGSGLLRDVPVEELSRQFDTVVLVDLVHLASVRLWLRAKGFKNVRLIERDISGFDAVVAGKEPEPLAFLRQVPYLDLVVSANVLSQIGIGAGRKSEAAGLPQSVVPRLIAAHLEGLSALPAYVCLLTDIGFRVVDRTGKLHQEVDLLHGIAPPAETARWSWPVIPTGEASRDYQVVHTVIASRMQPAPKAADRADAKHGDRA